MTGQNLLETCSSAWAPLPATSEDTDTAEKDVCENNFPLGSAGLSNGMTSLLLSVGELSDASSVIFDSGVDDVANKKASTVNLFIKFCVEQACEHEDPFPTRGLVCKQVGH